MRRPAPLLLALVGLWPAARANAAGFELLEHGAAATGMVGAFTAKADDASAVFYNAGGLARQQGLQLYVGTTLIFATNSATSPDPMYIPGGKADANSAFIPLPTIYATYGTGDLALGIGAFTQFGLDISWPKTWAGRFHVTDASLQSVTINPTVAYKLSPWIAIGAGLDITPARAELARGLNLVSSEGTIKFRGNTVAAGGNFAIHVETPPVGTIQKLTFGVNYRSRYDLDFSDGVFVVDGPPELSAMLHDAKASTVIKIPDMISFGVGARPNDRTFLQVQLDWTGWSRFKELQLKVNDPASPLAGLTIPEDWSDGYTVRAGAEHAFDAFTARLGLGYDWNPVPGRTLDPTIPDSDRFFASVGASVKLPSKLTADVGLMAVVFRDRKSDLLDFPVKYSTFALLTGLALQYRDAR